MKQIITISILISILCISCFKDCEKNNEGSILLKNATKDSLQISIDNDTINYVYMGGYKDKSVNVTEGHHDLKIEQKSGVVGLPNFWHFPIDIKECQSKTVDIN